MQFFLVSLINMMSLKIEINVIICAFTSIINKNKLFSLQKGICDKDQLFMMIRAKINKRFVFDWQNCLQILYFGWLKRSKTFFTIESGIYSKCKFYVC